MTTLVLVRHGETVGESSIRLNGVTDVALDATGREQMRRAGLALAGEPFDEVVSSPLCRSSEGARIVAGPARPEPKIIDGFREIHFGIFEKLTHAEAKAAHPEVYARWEAEGAAFEFPQGDSRRGFQTRIAETARQFLATPDVRRLAVLHKGVIKGIIGALTGLEFEAYSKLPVDLGSIHRLQHQDGRWVLIDNNVTKHLE